MKIACPPGYHLNGFVATHGLGHMSAYDREGTHIHMHIYMDIYVHIHIITVITALLEYDVVFASFTYFKMINKS